MPKKKMLEIRIPDPCDENWDTMQPSGCGRFCAQCSKTVLDFTDASDEELVRFFAKKPEHICGRFREDQLNRNIPFTEAGTHASLRHKLSKIAASLLLAQAVTSNLLAQDKQEQQIVLKGNITDYLNHAPLIGMTISIDGLNYQKYSDQNGQFSFVLPASFAAKKIIVTADYIPGSTPEKPGYLIRTAEAKAGPDGNNITVQLHRYPFQQLETVSVETPGVFLFKSGEVYIAPAEKVVSAKERLSLWKQAKNIFKKKKRKS
jgi:hypothetical protein